MNVTLPDDVSEIIVLWSVLFLVKQYIASALGLEFMNCILSSIFSSCQTKKRITINVQHHYLQLSTQLSWGTTTFISFPVRPVNKHTKLYLGLHVLLCVLLWLLEAMGQRPHQSLLLLGEGDPPGLLAQWTWMEINNMHIKTTCETY